MSQRTRVRMSDDEISTFLSGRRVMNLATIGPGGRPHLVAMWYGYTSSGQIGFATYSQSQKIKNLQRNGSLTALVEDGEHYGELRGVQLLCDTTLSDDRHIVNELGESLYERYQAEDAGALTDEIRPFVHAHMAKRTAVLLDVVDTASWDHSKLGQRS